jgi:Protein of unknown function (DUF2690)
MSTKRFVLTLAMITCILSAALVVPTTVHAQRNLTNSVTCWGDWCSGQNPRDTHCADDATTIKEVDIFATDGWTSTPINRGKLELRWSPTCKTKWARLNLTSAMKIRTVTITQDSGYEQDWYPSGRDFWALNTQPGVFYTNMIYSPNLRAYAHLVDADCQLCATEWA